MFYLLCSLDNLSKAEKITPSFINEKIYGVTCIKSGNLIFITFLIRANSTFKLGETILEFSQFKFNAEYPCYARPIGIDMVAKGNLIQKTSSWAMTTNNELSTIYLVAGIV